jgi:hypothetical protein
MITSRGRTTLDEETCGLLDWAEMSNVDVILNPFDWEVNGKKGRKAYLKTLFVHILEDELELKYADVPEIGGPVRHELEAGGVDADVVSDSGWIEDER